MALPSTYKAAFLDNVGGPLIVRDVPLTQPGPEEVLVKVLACGVCGTDAHVRAHGMGPRLKLPVVLGHELVGDVVAVGERVVAHRVGDRVGGPWHGGHDGRCEACRRGTFQMCAAQAVNGITRDGGFAEYVRLRAEAVVRLPGDADPVATAPLLCAGVTVFNALRKQHVEQGGLVAVQGLGALGHLAVQYARAMGYDVVVLSSSGGAAKRDLARQLGAIGFIDTAVDTDAAAALQARHGGASAIVCTAANPAAIGALLAGLRPQGTLLILAPVPGVTVNAQLMVTRGLRVAGWPSGHAIDSEDAVGFAARHGVAAHTETFAFADIEQAFARLQSGQARFKVVLDMRV